MIQRQMNENTTRKVNIHQYTSYRIEQVEYNLLLIARQEDILRLLHVKYQQIDANRQIEYQKQPVQPDHNHRELILFPKRASRARCDSFLGFYYNKTNKDAT